MATIYIELINILFSNNSRATTIFTKTFHNYQSGYLIIIIVNNKGCQCWVRMRINITCQVMKNIVSIGLYIYIYIYIYIKLLLKG